MIYCIRDTEGAKHCKGIAIFNVNVEHHTVITAPV